MEKRLFLMISFFALSACHRPQDEGSFVSIQIPSAKDYSKIAKQQAMATATVDYDRLCFVVNVKGPGLATTPASTCDVERGIFDSVSKPPGGTLELQVPGGDNRTFEVYGYLRDSTSETCPTMGPGWNSLSMRKIYFLGATTGVSVVPPTSEVKVSITMPDASQNLAVAKGWPVSCGGAPIIVRGFYGKMTMGSKQMNGTTYNLRAHVAERKLEPTLTSPSFKFQGGVR